MKVWLLVQNISIRNYITVILDLLISVIISFSLYISKKLLMDAFLNQYNFVQKFFKEYVLHFVIWPKVTLDTNVHIPQNKHTKYFALNHQSTLTFLLGIYDGETLCQFSLVASRLKWFLRILLPGGILALGFGCSPLALITSTSRQLLRSQIPSWTSPKAGEARAWRPTSCPGPRPSTKLGASPTSGGSRLHLYKEINVKETHQPRS